MKTMARNLLKTDEEYVAELQKMLKLMRVVASEAEEAGLHVRLKTRLTGTPGKLEDTMLSATRMLGAQPDEVEAQ
jgi:hypothetical protein